MDPTIQILEKMMDACTLRHRAIAQNLANAETEGYRRRDVEFREALSAAIESRDPGEINRFEPRIVTDLESPVGPDGNNVSTQKELGAMTRNNLLFELTSQVLTRKFAGLRKAIRGR